MFHSLFIVIENGTCIFEQHFLRKSKVDSQLVSGFINALGAFATEALGSGMQSLRLQTGEQLLIYPYHQHETTLIGIVIADSRDNSRLIQKLVNQILSDFTTIFDKHLRGGVSDISPFKEFRYTVETILAGRIASRTRLKMLLGVIAGVFLMGAILLSLVPMFINISNANISELGLQDIEFWNDLDALEFQTLQTITLVVVAFVMVFFLVIFLLPTFVAAYIAGNRRRGVYSAIILGVSIGALILIGSLYGAPVEGELAQVNAFLWYIAFSPLLISLSLLAGSFGGKLKERRKLYPLDEYHEKIL